MMLSARIARAASVRATPPRWVDEVRQLFHARSHELINRRGLRELMEKPEIVERFEPNQELVKTLLTHRDLMIQKKCAPARKVIDKVIQELIAKSAWTYSPGRPKSSPTRWRKSSGAEPFPASRRLARYGILKVDMSLFRLVLR